MRSAPGWASLVWEAALSVTLDSKIPGRKIRSLIYCFFEPGVPAPAPVNPWLSERIQFRINVN
jgi:hypothetical protein